MESPWREAKKRYVERFIALWEKHGLLTQEISYEHSHHPLIRGIRGLVHAILETPISPDTYPRNDLEALLKAAEKNKDFAKVIHSLAYKFGEAIPNMRSPESYVELIAQQPRWTIRLSDPIRPRRTGNKLNDLKLQMMKDIEDITKRAYRIISERKQKRSKERHRGEGWKI